MIGDGRVALRGRVKGAAVVESPRGQRLSITYRFALGSDQLDTKARQEIRRLARYLQGTRTRPTVFLAGFTDDLGGVGANLELV